jgi:hypothetical protein
MLHESNPFVMLYKTAHELLTANHDEVNNSETPFVRIFPSLRIELVAGADRRTENLPTSNEIAGIISYEHSAVSSRNIRIYLRDGEFNYTNISQTHALYMPLHYTLLFSNGDLGWLMQKKIAYRKEPIIDSDFVNVRINILLFSYLSDSFSSTWLMFGQSVTRTNLTGSVLINRTLEPIFTVGCKMLSSEKM